MIRVDLTKDEWNIMITMLKEHPHSYLAKPMINEIKNQMFRQ